MTRADRNDRALRAVPRLAALTAMGAAILACSGCTEPDRSAQWYMAHGDELQSKLAECKKYPSLDQSDSNCKAARQAFATLLAATQNPTPAASNAR